MDERVVGPVLVVSPLGLVAFEGAVLITVKSTFNLKVDNIIICIS